MEDNLITNCPTMKADILRTEDIFRMNYLPLKNKTTSKKSEFVIAITEDPPESCSDNMEM